MSSYIIQKSNGCRNAIVNNCALSFLNIIIKYFTIAQGWKNDTEEQRRRGMLRDYRKKSLDLQIINSRLGVEQNE